MAAPLALSVIIPTLDAEREIDALLTCLELQSVPPSEIIVIDSSSGDATAAEVSKHPSVVFYTIDKSDFNHGLTRDFALRRSTGEYVCFLTQDAVPASSRYLENLVSPMLADSSIALVSGRQLPKANARRFEQLVRGFNYPEVSSIRSKEDLSVYGIKTFFASDVCSCYRREAYLACGGFSDVETNEDMLMAARFIAAGFKVVYEPTAGVYHSHNLSPRQQFARNQAVGRFLEAHKDDLAGASEVGEGKRLVKEVSRQLIQEGEFSELCAFGVDCAARFFGNRSGRRQVRRRD